MSKKRDAIILLVVAAVVVVFMLTDHDSPEEEQSRLDSIGTAKTIESTLPESEQVGAGESNMAGASSPARDVPHGYFPLVPGSKWIYMVRGPKRLVSQAEWSMTLTRRPEEGAPGEVVVGFGEQKNKTRIWLAGNAIQFDGLPFTEPMEYLGNRPLAVSGALLPPAAKISQDAVWKQEFTRKVDYRYRDKRGRPQSTTAEAQQSDRAQVTEVEEITVPAGHFAAMRISWLSRLTLRAAGRPVLQALTSEPYRKELMWVADGIGIVRRRIEYPAYRDAECWFELWRYYRPEITELNED